MKKIFIMAMFLVLVTAAANAACTSTKTYTACKPGYYLSNGTCVSCPRAFGGGTPTTVDNNTGGITSCYLPSGTTFSDITGSGTYTSNCYYSN